MMRSRLSKAELVQAYIKASDTALQLGLTTPSRTSFKPTLDGSMYERCEHAKSGFGTPGPRQAHKRSLHEEP